jgi:hypothetical protein
MEKDGGVINRVLCAYLTFRKLEDFFSANYKPGCQADEKNGEPIN